MVKLAMRKGKSFASRKYGVSLPSVKRWCKRYDGKNYREEPSTAQSSKTAYRGRGNGTVKKRYEWYEWDGVYMEAQANGYQQSFSGMLHAAKRLGMKDKKVKRSHRNDQRYFYDWEKFRSERDLNQKLAEYLEWSNRKPMRTMGGKSPLELLAEKLKV